MMHLKRLLAIAWVSLWVCPSLGWSALQFSESGQTILEPRDPLGSSSAIIQVVRSGSASQAASVRVLITHGTATPKDDYSGGEGTLTWAAGETGARTLSLTIRGDSLSEPDETVHFTVTDAVGDTLGSPQTTKITIVNSNPQTADAEGLTPQQQAVGQTVDQLCPVSPTPGQVLPPACTTLADLSDEEQQQALEDITPKHVTQQSADVGVAQQGASRAVGQRMQTVRAGGGAGVQNDVTLMSPDGTLPLALLLSEAGTLGGSAGGELLDDRWGAFLSGQLSMADQDSTEERVGYVSKGQQLTGGVDYRISDRWFAGTALSYSVSEADINADNGSQDGQVILLTGFVSHFLTDAWYVDGYVSTGTATYDTERIVRLGDERAVITSTSDSTPVSVGATTGYDMTRGAWSFGGYGRVDVNRLVIDAYDEEGGQGLALSLDEQSTTSTTTTLGAQASFVKSVSYGVWVPKLTAEWIHDLDDGNRMVDARFVENPGAGTFSYETGKTDQDYFTLGWSMAGTFTEGRSAFLRYEALLGKADYIAELVEIGARIHF